MPRADTREELIASTQDLLWERGYAATSPRAILDRAGAGQGSMYHHFAGKEDLAAAAFRRTADRLLDAASAVLDDPGDTGGALDAGGAGGAGGGGGAGGAVGRVQAYLLRRRDVLRGCPVGRMAGDADVLGTPALREILAGTFDRIRAATTEVLAEAVRRGELPADVDPAQLADTVLAVVQGGYVLARAAGNPAPFDRAVRGAVDLLERARTAGR
nr:TetR/AcrR family transcriptional regulator [Nakamurella endophytica]